MFQQRVLDQYDTMIDEYGLTVIDATLPIPEQQRLVREICLRQFGDYLPHRSDT